MKFVDNRIFNFLEQNVFLSKSLISSQTLFLKRVAFSFIFYETFIESKEQVYKLRHQDGMVLFKLKQ